MAAARHARRRPSRATTRRCGHVGGPASGSRPDPWPRAPPSWVVGGPPEVALALGRQFRRLSWDYSEQEGPAGSAGARREGRAGREASGPAPGTAPVRRSPPPDAVTRRGLRLKAHLDISTCERRTADPRKKHSRACPDGRVPHQATAGHAVAGRHARRRRRGRPVCPSLVRRGREGALSDAPPAQGASRPPETPPQYSCT